MRSAMVRVMFLIFSGALSVITQLTDSTIGRIIPDGCPNYGSFCNSSETQPCCGKGLSCNPSKSLLERCNCNAGFYWINNQCEQQKFCIHNENCGFMKYAECSEDDVCACKSNYLEIDLPLCRPLIGAFCETTEECFPDNSICVNQKCKCADEFVSLSNENCVPTYFNLKCNPRDEVCQETQYFSCTNDGKCFCEPNHVAFNNTKCLPLLNETCTKSEHCVIDNSICINNKCQCEPKYVPRSNNRCLPIYLHEKCKNDDDCSNIENSKCSIFHECVCRKNYFYLNERTCSPAIGGLCALNADCLMDNSVCVDNKCQCTVHSKHISSRICLPVLYKYCDSDDDCIDIKFTECVANNTCVCQSNYLASEDKTSCLLDINGICKLDENCGTKNSRCYYNRCQCKKYFFSEFINGKYQCIQGFLLGNSCIENKHCALIKYSECSEDKICICRNNYYAIDNRTLCSPIIGGDCSSDKECKLDNSHCFNDKCQCKPNYLPVSDHRCILKQLAVSCNDVLDCGEPWHTECSTNKHCLCKFNTGIYNNATCYPLLKGLCWKDEQCIVPNSVCIDYHCQCSQPNFKAVANNLCVSGH